jgi:CYTH domain-containing protein
MGTEIERKFLVDGVIDTTIEYDNITQGYITIDPVTSVRIRFITKKNYQNPCAFITVKTAVNSVTRHEYEYEIPSEDAAQMLSTSCKYWVTKKRTKIIVGSHWWDVDIFTGMNSGLTLAEIELCSELEQFEKPSWLGKEVTTDPRYINANLAITPYSLW